MDLPGKTKCDAVTASPSMMRSTQLYMQRKGHKGGYVELCPCFRCCSFELQQHGIKRKGNELLLRSKHPGCSL
eukprot:1160420-Pelagomonas_calceolata.AAC.15